MNTMVHHDPAGLRSFPPVRGRWWDGRLVWVAIPFCVFSLAGLSSAQRIEDNFNDGNDGDWTRYDPLAPFGLSASFSFPNGGYRIQTTMPTGMAENPGRGGSLRQDATFTNFYVTVDLVDWKDDTRQAFGLLARIGSPGLGMTTGYVFTYERGSGVTSTSGDLDISRLDGEVPQGVPTGPSSIHLDPEQDYRFVFLGKGSSLEGRVYALTNLTTPLISIGGNDATYGSGYLGLVVYDNSGGNGVTDATFDNFFALDLEPPRLTFEWVPNFGDYTVSWPTDPPGFNLESAISLGPSAMWTEVTDIQDFGDHKSHYEQVEPGSGNKFFRLKRP
jgi:hypothetical protein